MKNNQNHYNYSGYVIGAGLIFVPALFYIMLPGLIINSAAFFIYIFGILFITFELIRNKKRNSAFMISGVGFFLLAFQFFNSDNTFYTVVFILLSSISFLIFVAGLIESAQRRKTKAANDEDNKKWSRPFQTLQDIIGIICSILSIIGFIVEFIL
ncbi:hypothetical protein [Corticicoccus populi]|uniref:DUF308 domain-containing protein n=1 Tax=Corticicoccus populi TaxID=1812821 RepID=A0ABW5WWI1_9STAP